MEYNNKDIVDIKLYRIVGTTGEFCMAPLVFDEQVFNREIPFCRVYSLESKEKLEKLFLRNQISYFVEWEEKPLFKRLFSGDGKEKNVFTIRINEADAEKARELVQGLGAVKIRKGGGARRESGRKSE